MLKINKLTNFHKEIIGLFGSSIQIYCKSNNPEPKLNCYGNRLYVIMGGAQKTIGGNRPKLPFSYYKHVIEAQIWL